MNNDPAGQPAPQGGFKTGGWYSGYQYWNGTFAPQAGVIHPASDQPGAGETVSEEVNVAGDVAVGNAPGTNQEYIDEQNALNNPPPSTPSTPGAGTPGAGTPGGALTPEQEEVDFQAIYKNIQENSGVKALEDEYLEKERIFIENKGKINDNPFLSEATRVGRERKLTELFNDNTANLQNKIAMRKADTEMMMNLQLKQIDFNSQQSQLAFEQLNSLIGMGAFDNASGELIAEWTRKTGLSSDIILSAVKASKKANVDTQIITSTADSGEVTISVINSQTGEIINQSSLGNVGNAEGGGGGSTAGNTEAQFMQSADTIKGKDINGQWWGEFPQLVANYAPYYSLEEIYSLYLKSSLGQQYGTPNEDAGEIKGLYDYYRSGKE